MNLWGDECEREGRMNVRVSGGMSALSNYDKLRQHVSIEDTRVEPVNRFAALD